MYKGVKTVRYSDLRLPPVRPEKSLSRLPHRGIITHHYLRTVHHRPGSLAAVVVMEEEGGGADLERRQQALTTPLWVHQRAIPQFHLQHRK